MTRIYTVVNLRPLDRCPDAETALCVIGRCSRSLIIHGLRDPHQHQFTLSIAHRMIFSQTHCGLVHSVSYAQSSTQRARRTRLLQIRTLLWSNRDDRVMLFYTRPVAMLIISSHQLMCATWSSHSLTEAVYVVRQQVILSLIPSSRIRNEFDRDLTSSTLVFINARHTLTALVIAHRE